jgi:diguanylate cyclase (GGDEF)-like protein
MQAVANAVQGACRDADTVARYGGEEMAVLLPCVGTARAAAIGESIRAAVEATTVRFQDAELRVTLSAGLATYPHHAANVADLIAAADAGLYQAKHSGRNRVACAAEVPV